ncbi:hypothetical protein [Granulicella aggregans]|uniref:hypothetical protein n=1 Tax=Granulicella aggregans TaxID=474949 RepID=UPI0021E07CD1|nr:hypothetical protein [Granulicella aggregans]
MARKPHIQDSDEHAPWPQPEDLRQWLNEESRRVMKEAELRIIDATELVTGFLTGHISREEAQERSAEYHRRWGDALRDVPELKDGMTAQEIYAAQREHREGQTAAKKWAGKPSSDRGGR